MPQPYLFLAIGVVAAVTALVVWLNSEDERPVRVGQRYRRNSETSRRIHSSDIRRRACNPPQPDAECMICCENAVTTKFLPCQHACMCEECAVKYIQMCEELNHGKKCPYCRVAINEYKKI